jgi:hypothetical protein
LRDTRTWTCLEENGEIDFDELSHRSEDEVESLEEEGPFSRSPLLECECRRESGYDEVGVSKCGSLRPVRSGRREGEEAFDTERDCREIEVPPSEVERHVRPVSSSSFLLSSFLNETFESLREPC